MKNTKKAFTLVELIVVITILAVLATVAFISLTGHAQDAKNSKVTADIRTLASAIETKATRDGALAHDLVTANATFANNTMSGATQEYASGSAISGSAYTIGNANFQALGQNGDDFKDSSSTPRHYIMAGVGTRYQLAGEIINGNGEYVVVLKGNYVDDGGTNVVDALIGTNAGTQTALVNKNNTAASEVY